MLSRASRSCNLLLHPLQRVTTISPAWNTLPLHRSAPRLLHTALVVRQSAPARQVPAEDTTPNHISWQKELLRQLPVELLLLLDRPLNHIHPNDLGQRVRSYPLPSSSCPITYLDLFSTTWNLCRLARQLLKIGNPSRILQMLHIAKRLGIAEMSNKELYHKIATMLADAGHWATVLELDDISRDYMGSTTVYLLNTWIRALVMRNTFLQLPLVLRRFKEEGIAPNESTFRILVLGYLRNHDLGSAMRTLDVMKQHGFAPDARMQAIIAAGYRSFGPDPAVKRETLQALHHATPSTATYICNALLQLSIEADDREWTGIMLELLRFDHLDLYGLVNPGGGTFVPEDDDELHDLTMSDTSVRAASTLRITRSRFHIAPDVATYTILLNYAGHHQDLRSAVSLVAQMDRAGVQADAMAFAGLMSVMFRASLPNAALRIIQDVCPPTDTTREIIKSLAKALDGQGDLEIPTVTAPPSIVLFNELAEGLLPLLRLPGLVLVLGLMEASGLRPDGDTIKLVAKYCDKVENADLDILVSISSHLLSSFDDATLHHCDVLLEAFFRRATRERGMSAWIPQHVCAQHQPSSVPKLLSAYPRGYELTAGLGLAAPGKEKTAIDSLIAALTKRGVLASRQMFRFRLQYEIARGDVQAVQRVFTAMLDRGFVPRTEHYNLLLQAYAQAGNLDGAREVLAAALKDGLRPSVATYTILITGCARAGDPDGAIRAFDEMVRAKIQPDRAAIDALVSAWVRVGQFTAARETMIAAWPVGVKQPEGLETMSLKQMKRLFVELWPDGKARRAGSSRVERADLLGRLRPFLQQYDRARTSRRIPEREHRGGPEDSTRYRERDKDARVKQTGEDSDHKAVSQGRRD